MKRINESTYDCSFEDGLKVRVNDTQAYLLKKTKDGGLQMEYVDKSKIYACVDCGRKYKSIPIYSNKSFMVEDI